MLANRLSKSSDGAEHGLNVELGSTRTEIRNLLNNIAAEREYSLFWDED